MTLILPVTPTWLPDETFFSLCSRIHRLSCNSLSRTTTLALFGDLRIGQAHDLPGGLDQFVARSDGAWGDVDEIVLRHTVLPYYLPFREGAQADAKAAMASRFPGGLKYRLGLLTSRFRANHPLKACNACMAEDLAQHFTSYWRLAHQLPSVWVCPTHGLPLMVSTVKSTGVRRFHWLLPDEGEFESCADRVWAHPLDRSDVTALQRLADNSLALAGLPEGTQFTPERILRAYGQQLLHLGLTKSTGAICWQQAAESYTKALAPLRSATALSALPATPDAALAEIRRFLRNPARYNTHPIRHLAMIQWLFGSLGRFVESYHNAVTTPVLHSAPPKPIGVDVPDRRRAEFLDLLQKSFSVTRASRTLGIDTATGMAWATEAGISVTRRSKILRPNRRAALVEALRGGMSKKEAATRFGVSVTTVTTTLRTEIDLHQTWAMAQKSIKQAQHRTAWSALMRSHPDGGVKALRLQAPSTYAWLYRNDRAWLMAEVEKLPNKVVGNHAHVPWDERDRQLASEVERVAGEIAEQTGRSAVARWQLYQRIPELKAKAGALDRLPLTQSVLNRVTRKRRKAEGGLLFR